MWRHICHENGLVTEELASAVDKFQEAQAATETSSGDLANITSEIDADPLLEPAVLSAIIFINLDDCWLTLCSHWKGPTKVTRKFQIFRSPYKLGRILPVATGSQPAVIEVDEDNGRKGSLFKQQICTDVRGNIYQISRATFCSCSSFLGFVDQDALLKSLQFHIDYSCQCYEKIAVRQQDH